MFMAPHAFVIQRTQTLKLHESNMNSVIHNRKIKTVASDNTANVKQIKPCKHETNDDVFKCDSKQFQNEYPVTIQKQFRSLDIESRKLFFESTAHRERTSLPTTHSENQTNVIQQPIQHSFQTHYFLPYLGELVRVCLEFYCAILRVPKQMVLFHHSRMWEIANQPNMLICSLPTFNMSYPTVQTFSRRSCSPLSIHSGRSTAKSNTKQTFSFQNTDDNKKFQVLQSPYQTTAKIDEYSDSAEILAQNFNNNEYKTFVNYATSRDRSAAQTPVSRLHKIGAKGFNILQPNACFQKKQKSKISNQTLQIDADNCNNTDNFVQTAKNLEKADIIATFKQNSNLYKNLGTEPQQYPKLRPKDGKKVDFGITTLDLNPPISPMKSFIDKLNMLDDKHKNNKTQSEDISEFSDSKMSETQSVDTCDGNVSECSSANGNADTVSPTSTVKKSISDEKKHKDPVSIESNNFLSVSNHDDEDNIDSKDKNSLAPLRKWMAKIKTICARANNMANAFHNECVKEIEFLDDQSNTSKIVFDANIDAGNIEIFTKTNEPEHWERVAKMLKVLDQKDSRRLRDLTTEHVQRALADLHSARYLKILDAVKSSLQLLHDEIRDVQTECNKDLFPATTNIHKLNQFDSEYDSDDAVDASIDTRLTLSAMKTTPVTEAQNKNEVLTENSLMTVNDQRPSIKKSTTIAATFDKNPDNKQSKSSNNSGRRLSVTFDGEVDFQQQKGLQQNKRASVRPRKNSRFGNGAKNLKTADVNEQGSRSSFMSQIAEENGGEFPVFDEQPRVSIAKRMSILSQILDIPEDVLTRAETENASEAEYSDFHALEALAKKNRHKRQSFVQCDQNKDTNEYVEDVLLEKIDKLELELQAMKQKCLHLSSDHKHMSLNQHKIVAALKESQNEARKMEWFQDHNTRASITTCEKSVQTPRTSGTTENTIVQRTQSDVRYLAVEEENQKNTDKLKPTVDGQRNSFVSEGLPVSHANHAKQATNASHHPHRPSKKSIRVRRVTKKC